MIVKQALKFETFSLHKIHAADTLAFSAEAYSRFKFGHGGYAEQFGRELALKFIRAHSELLLSEEKIVLLPSPYDSIPTASNAMARSFRTVLNAFLARHEKKSLLESKIHRYKTYSVDYGNLDFEERLRLISADTYHIDRDFLKEGLVLLIDDVRITGSHELMIRNLIRKNEVPGHFVFLYYAELADKSVAPDFENYLNYFFVKDIRGILEMIHADFFIFNTRVIKYILGCDQKQFGLVLETVQKDKLVQLCDHAFGNNYHLMTEYKENLERIQQHIHYGH
ncbi:MAG: hypothetical protein FD123_2060 [Bacteroidetes bacterium]|nr:MAG: hypothetical protein FD123_2060 [Bacteroidota bacterium]